MSRIPAPAITSASPSLAQVTPIAPAASSLWAMAGIFWPLVWGRQFLPAPMIVRAILFRLRCITSRSTQSAGVSRSCFERPTSDASAAGDVRVTKSLPRERLGPLGWADYTPGAENGNAQETFRPLGHWSESDQTL